MEDGHLHLALQWFDDFNIDAYLDDGTIYVKLKEFDTHVQISNAEIHYRAMLQEEEND
jgi:hypothetical protein